MLKVCLLACYAHVIQLVENAERERSQADSQLCLQFEGDLLQLG